MIPDQDRVEDTFRPYEHALARIPFIAFHATITNPDYHRLNHPRVKANNIWGYAISFAREIFEGNSNINFYIHHNTASIKVNGFNHEVLFRYKKADKNGISRTVQTRLSDLYHDHSTRSLFDGINDPDRVEVNYILNNLATKIEDVRVTARNKKRIVWSYSILSKADVITIPSGPQGGDESYGITNHAEEIVNLKNGIIPKEKDNETE